jgi:hypothetical protein
VNPGYIKTSEKQDSELKTHLMMIIENIKKDINSFLKEIQENTAKQLEVFKKETHTQKKSLKKL